jgi:hypothetical protein
MFIPIPNTIENIIPAICFFSFLKEKISDNDNNKGK